MTAPAEAPWRRRHLVALVVTIVLGLLSRAVAPWLPPWWLEVGDGLYAMAVYWVAVLLVPRVNVWVMVGVAVAFCFAVEISQLYHAPWLDAIRATRIGGLFLGHGFSMDDIMAYLAGGAIAGILDAFSLRAPQRERKL